VLVIVRSHSCWNPLLRSTHVLGFPLLRKSPRVTLVQEWPQTQPWPRFTLTQQRPKWRGLNILVLSFYSKQFVFPVLSVLSVWLRDQVPHPYGTTDTYTEACLYPLYLCVYVRCISVFMSWVKKKGKAVPLHAMEALGGRGGIAPTHSRPRH
jgi:hypothetical protein